DRSGFVVGYGASETRAKMALGGIEWAYLPTRLSVLETRTPAPLRRYFVEFFIWVPVSPFAIGDEWTLVWSVYEVAGSSVTPVNTLPTALATATGKAPPASFGIEDRAGLRVSASGEPEWVVSGDAPRSGLIGGPGGERR